MSVAEASSRASLKAMRRVASEENDQTGRGGVVSGGDSVDAVSDGG